MSRLFGGVVALVALLVTPGLLFYFDITPKIFVLLAGTAAALLWAAASGLRVAGRPRSFAIFSGIVFLNVASLAISTGLSVRPELSIFGSNWRQYGSVTQASICLFAWVVALACAGNSGRVRTVLRAITVAGAISAVYGICQYFGADPLLSPAAYRAGEGIFTIVRPPGTLGYSSYFATWLLFVVFLALASKSIETAPAWRRFAVSAAALAGCAMLLTGTRAAILGLIAGAAAWTAVRQVRIPRRVFILAAPGAALLAVFYFAPTGRALRARVHWSEDDPWGGARLALWRDSLRMALHRPTAGYGPEVFTAEFPRFESVALAQAYPDFAHESPHNMFLDMFVAQGVPGLLLLMALCAAGLAAAFREKQPGFAAALAAGIVSQQFTAFIAPTAMVLWVTVALLIASETAPAEPKRRRSFVAAATLSAAALLYMATRIGVADAALASAQHRLDQADLRGASEQYQRYERLRFPGGSADVWYSRVLFALASQSPSPQLRRAAVTQSAAVALLATHTAEDPFNAWYNLAIVCGTQEDAGCAERSLRAAIDAHPKWFKPRWTLARLLSAEGRMPDALRQATMAVELDGQKHREVRDALDSIRAQLARARPLLQE